MPKPTVDAAYQAGAVAATAAGPARVTGKWGWGATNSVIAGVDDENPIDTRWQRDSFSGDLPVTLLGFRLASHRSWKSVADLSATNAAGESF
ncbi:hypothetical protein FYK55_25270 [Roseiconus nitratireducens]|uniref:Uncharacterized protein n=1 Tax=Roseiconus nitratireducens TaxID=2605748 RepID=A0A5M6CV07_9BACT|nr:hypothetical protein [Roseiconus nitratireducens]KAA5539054.1 hypothetical protein FYK55_25270 [Roseiconus nitratireducens]